MLVQKSIYKSIIQYLPIPDNIIHLQILKGLQFALNIIKERICHLETILSTALRQGFESGLINKKLKTEQKSIHKVLKRAKYKNNYPLLGKQAMLQFPGKRLIAFTLKDLTFNFPLLVRTREDIIFLWQKVNISRQKLYCNDEHLFILMKLFKTDYFIFNLRVKYSQNEYQ